MSVRLSAILGLTIALLGAPTAAQAADDVELIVRRDPGLSAPERAEVRSEAGVQYERAVRLADTEVVSVPAADAAHALVTFAPTRTCAGRCATTACGRPPSRARTRCGTTSGA